MHLRWKATPAGMACSSLASSPVGRLRKSPSKSNLFSWMAASASVKAGNTRLIRTASDSHPARLLEKTSTP